MSLAEIAAVSCVLLTKVVVRLLPFHCTTEAEIKPVPFTVRMKAGPRAVAIEGDKELMLGVGLGGGWPGGGGLELPPPPPRHAVRPTANARGSRYSPREIFFRVASDISASSLT